MLWINKYSNCFCSQGTQCIEETVKPFILTHCDIHAKDRCSYIFCMEGRSTNLVQELVRGEEKGERLHRVSEDFSKKVTFEPDPSYEGQMSVRQMLRQRWHLLYPMHLLISIVFWLNRR